MANSAVGGRTAFGSEINKVFQRTAQTNMSRSRQKRAILKKSYNGTYSFFVDVLDSSGKVEKQNIGPIPLVGSTEELASKGTPQEMENVWEVLITYKGPSVTYGRAQIIRRVGSTLLSEIQETEQANQLQLTGAAYAMPGPGMI